MPAALVCVRLYWGHCAQWSSKTKDNDARQRQSLLASFPTKWGRERGGQSQVCQHLVGTQTLPTGLITSWHLIGGKRTDEGREVEIFCPLYLENIFMQIFEHTYSEPEALGFSETYFGNTTWRFPVLTYFGPWLSPRPWNLQTPWLPFTSIFAPLSCLDFYSSGFTYLSVLCPCSFIFQLYADVVCFSWVPVKSLQSCLTLWDPVGLLCLWDSPGKNNWSGLPCPPPDPGMELASRPSDGTSFSYVSCIGRWVLYH